MTEIAPQNFLVLLFIIKQRKSYRATVIRNGAPQAYNMFSQYWTCMLLMWICFTEDYCCRRWWWMTMVGRGLMQACWAVGSTLRVQPGEQIPLVTMVSMPWKDSSHLSVIQNKWRRSGSGERGVGEWWKVIY